MIEEILQQNGLTKNEVVLYLSILEAGEITIGRLAHKTHIKRTTIYSTLEKLKSDGLIAVQKKKGVQYLSATSPRLLIERFKKSAQLAEQSLPLLMEMAYSSPLKPRLKFYEGLDDIKNIVREFSLSKEQTIGFTDYELMPTELLQCIRNEIIPNRKKLQNPAKFIIPNSPKNKEIQQRDNENFAEHRLVNFPAEQNPIELLMYDKSKIAFLSYTQNERFGVVLDSPAIYQTLRNIFMLVWNATT